MIQQLYIFDLDGTLSLADHRRHLVEPTPCPHCGWIKKCDHSLSESAQIDKGLKPKLRPKFIPRWQEFYEACDKDLPNPGVITMFNNLYLQGREILIFSGRDSSVRQKTLDWLEKHTYLEAGELNLMLQMRPTGDSTPDDVLKENWLLAMKPQDRKRLVAVFDDRERVVAMWRRNGVTCFQVAPGDF